jgi:hypothetical protein
LKRILKFLSSSAGSGDSVRSLHALSGLVTNSTLFHQVQQLVLSFSGRPTETKQKKQRTSKSTQQKIQKGADINYRTELPCVKNPDPNTAPQL